VIEAVLTGNVDGIFGERLLEGATSSGSTSGKQWKWYTVAGFESIEHGGCALNISDVLNVPENFSGRVCERPYSMAIPVTPHQKNPRRVISFA
jgi:hypothetical protein